MAVVLICYVAVYFGKTDGHKAFIPCILPHSIHSRKIPHFKKKWLIKIKYVTTDTFVLARNLNEDLKPTGKFFFIIIILSLMILISKRKRVMVWLLSRCY